MSALQTVEEAARAAEAEWNKAPTETRPPRTRRCSTCCLPLPRRDAPEEKIQQIIGGKHEHTHAEREKFEASLRTCEGFHAVGSEISYRLRREGAAGSR